MSKKRSRDRRTFHRNVVKRLPQYAIDGKSRKGCLSAETERAEIDLRIYCPDTQQVLSQKTLPDKEGEQVGAVELIKRDGVKLIPGVFTGDAGITCPEVISAIADLGHNYILGVKGNAGNVFEQIHAHPWDKVVKEYKHFTEAHGRQEIRRLKALKISNFPHIEEFSKYKNVSVVFQLVTTTYHVKEDDYTGTTRYFIGDQGALAMSLPHALAYIRHHWGIESYHWIRDAILNEDASLQKRRSGSRFLAGLRTAVHRVGMTTFGSVKKFVDHFVADPKGTIEKVDQS